MPSTMPDTDVANGLGFSIYNMNDWVLPARIFLMTPRFSLLFDLSFIWMPPHPNQIWQRDSHCLWRGIYVKWQFSARGDFISQKTFGNVQKFSGCHNWGGDATGILWVEARIAAKSLSMNEAVLTTKNYPARNGNSAEAEKP